MSHREKLRFLESQDNNRIISKKINQLCRWYPSLTKWRSPPFVDQKQQYRHLLQFLNKNFLQFLNPHAIETLNPHTILASTLKFPTITSRFWTPPRWPLWWSWRQRLPRWGSFHLKLLVHIYHYFSFFFIETVYPQN